MSKIEFTQKQINKINSLLKGEYNYDKMKTQSEIMYQLFDKSHSIYSGRAVVKVYKYLLTQGIDVEKISI